MRAANDNRLAALPFFIPRAEMPQIDDPEDCATWFIRRGVAISRLSDISSELLHNHQRVAIDPVRAALIPHEALLQPIIAAIEGYIIDGNHRWYLARERGELIHAVVRVLIPFGQALTLIQDYPNLRHAEGEQ